MKIYQCNYRRREVTAEECYVCRQAGKADPLMAGRPECKAKNVVEVEG